MAAKNYDYVEKVMPPLMPRTAANKRRYRAILRRLVRETVIHENALLGVLYGSWTMKKATDRADRIAKELVP